jgi:hypothetical protein
MSKLPLDIIRKIKEYQIKQLPKIFHESNDYMHGSIGSDGILLYPLEGFDQDPPDSDSITEGFHRSNLWSMNNIIHTTHNYNYKDQMPPMVNCLKIHQDNFFVHLKWFLRSDFLKSIKKVYRKFSKNNNTYTQRLDPGNLNGSEITFRSGEIVKYLNKNFQKDPLISEEYDKGYITIEYINDKTISVNFKSFSDPFKDLTMYIDNIHNPATYNTVSCISKLDNIIYDPNDTITYIDIFLNNKLSNIKYNDTLDNTIKKLKALGHLFSDGYITKDNDYYVYLYSHWHNYYIYLETDLNIYGVDRKAQFYNNKYYYDIISVDPLEPNTVEHIGYLNQDSDSDSDSNDDDDIYYD